jgi:hypothetical protein
MVNDLIPCKAIMPVNSYPVDNRIVFVSTENNSRINYILNNVGKTISLFRRSRTSYNNIDTVPDFALKFYRAYNLVRSEPLFSRMVEELHNSYVEKMGMKLYNPYLFELTQKQDAYDQRMRPIMNKRLEVFKPERDAVEVVLSELRSLMASYSKYPKYNPTAKKILAKIKPIRKKLSALENNLDKLERVIYTEFNRKRNDAYELFKEELQNKYRAELDQWLFIRMNCSWNMMIDCLEKTNLPYKKYLSYEPYLISNNMSIFIAEGLAMRTGDGNCIVLTSEHWDIFNKLLTNAQNILISEQLISLMENYAYNLVIPETIFSEEDKLLSQQLMLFADVVKNAFEKITDTTEDFDVQMNKYVSTVIKQSDTVLSEGNVDAYLGGSARNKFYAEQRKRL